MIHETHSKGLQREFIDSKHEGAYWQWLEEQMTAERARCLELTALLATCYRLTGADPDGNEDWRLAERAVQEVLRLREDSEEEAEEYEETVARLTRERDALADMISAKNDNTTALAVNILRDWPRERIERFAKHLLGEESELSRLQAVLPKEGK